MDTGHYNCRDYYISPHFAPATLISGNRAPLYRHDSYIELELRSRSPASAKPKFPLLQLPLELRQHIYSFLVPRTQELEQSKASRSVKDLSPPPVVWIRGCTSLLAVCKQMHDEVAAMMYGHSTFLLFVTFSGITFRFRWMLPSGLAPTKSYNFLDLMPTRYLQLVRKVIVHVDHVDSYTGMIKFNISGKGLTHGLRKQVQRLVLALQPRSNSSASDTAGSNMESLARVVVRISSSNALLDTIKAPPDSSDTRASHETKDNMPDGVREMLEPFGDLAGVREVQITGAVSNGFAHELETRMQSNEPRTRHSYCCDHSMADRVEHSAVPLCVYGNDMD